MGTRGLWGLRKDGIDKLTYNHFDSYPSSLGVIIIDFISNHSANELKTIFDRIILVDEDIKPTDKQIKECHNYTDLSVGRQDIQDWYCLLRNSQSLPESYANGLKYMIDSHDFIKDSLFCEWAYIINLDTEKLEVYKGFQKKAQENRYKCSTKDNYANCKLLKEIPLKELKNFIIEKLEK